GVDVRRRWRRIRDREADHRAAATERQQARRSDRRNSVQVAQTLLEFTDANPGWLILFVSFALKDDPERKCLFGTEAGIDTGQLDEAPDQQPCTNQQHDGERHLSDDQRRSHPLSTDARTAARGFAQETLDPSAAELECRQYPEGEAGREGDRKRED